MLKCFPEVPVSPSIECEFSHRVLSQKLNLHESHCSTVCRFHQGTRIRYRRTCGTSRQHVNFIACDERWWQVSIEISTCEARDHQRELQGRKYSFAALTDEDDACRCIDKAPSRYSVQVYVMWYCRRQYTCHRGAKSKVIRWYEKVRVTCVFFV